MIEALERTTAMVETSEDLARSAMLFAREVRDRSERGESL